MKHVSNEDAAPHSLAFPACNALPPHSFIHSHGQKLQLKQPSLQPFPAFQKEDHFSISLGPPTLEIIIKKVSGKALKQLAHIAIYF